MEKYITGRTIVHVRDQIVARKLLSQNSQGLASRRKLQQADAGPVPQSGIRLAFVPKSALQSIRIKSQDNFTNIETLCVRTAKVDWRHEKDADFIHESRESQTLLTSTEDASQEAINAVSRVRSLSGKDPGINSTTAAELEGGRFDILEPEGNQGVVHPSGVVGNALHERAPLLT